MSEPQEPMVPISAKFIQDAVELIGTSPEDLDRARQQGASEAVVGYDKGFALGFDTGYSARQDTRSFVHGILAGFEAGNEERKQLVRELLARGRPQRQHEQADIELEAG